MGEVVIYIIKSSLALSLFYLFYKLMLSKETFHKFNRLAILTILFVSFILPLLNIQLNPGFWKEVSVLTPESPVNPDSFTVINHPKVYWPGIIIIIYLTGFMITAAISVISLYRMRYVIMCGSLLEIKAGAKLYIHNKNLAPFSWMNIIAISQKDYDECGAEILCHENAHIKMRHSYDLILAEIVKTIHWFNPASWLLKRELHSIHEYQADNSVIDSGIDSTKYQLLLIKKAVGNRLYTMANSFNHSKLKNRITMISRKKSNTAAKLRILMLLPLSLIVMSSYASEMFRETLSPLSVIKVSNKPDTTKQIEIRIKSRSGEMSQKRPQSNMQVPDDVLVIVDKVVYERKKLNDIDPRNIESVTVLRGEKATEKYGVEGIKGVIEITLKKGEE